MVALIREAFAHGVKFTAHGKDTRAVSFVAQVIGARDVFHAQLEIAVGPLRRHDATGAGHEKEQRRQDDRCKDLGDHARIGDENIAECGGVG